MVRKSKYKWLFSFLAHQIPFLSSFFILVFSFALPPIFNTKSVLVLIPIFYWGIEKNTSFDFIFVMLFGFIQDLLDGTQFGFNMFIFLSIYFLAFYQKFFPLDASFAFSYLAFSLLSLIALLLKYTVISSIFVVNINFFSVIISWAVLILFYPIFYYILQKLNYKIVRKY